MKYYLVKDKKTKKIYLIQANSSEKARELITELVGFPKGLEWVLHENSPNKLMERFGVYNNESYWLRHFKAGPILDVTRNMKGKPNQSGI